LQGSGETLIGLKQILKRKSRGRPDMTDTARAKNYEWRLVLLFFFTWGFVFLDRLAISFLTPKLIEVFNINNAQVGMIGTVTTGCYAIATILFSMVAGRIRKPRKYLVMSVVAVAVGAALCSQVHSYAQLLVVRGLVGAFAGPVLPLIMVLVSKAASNKSFGLDTGIINLGVVVIAVVLGPIWITQILQLSTWQTAFLSYSFPILVIALLIAVLVREEEIAAQPAAGNKSEDTGRGNAIAEFLRFGNMRACSLISILAMSGYWCIMLYAPLYLTRVNLKSIQTMGFISSTMGLTMVVYAILIPKLSDIFGRKPILTIFLILPAIGTSLMALFPGGNVSTLAYVITGGILGCVMPVYAIIIPLESVPDHLKAASNSFVIGLGEIIGGAMFPFIGGSIADAVSLPAMMGVASGLLVIGIITSLFIRETLPKKVRPAAAPGA
jgi:ACS family hexuronate transporter-like MFS transporter